jgi:hypothetical protein
VAAALNREAMFISANGPSTLPKDPIMNRSDGNDVSRRSLFKRSLVGAASVYGAGALERTADAGTDGKYPKDDRGTAE